MMSTLPNSGVLREMQLQAYSDSERWFPDTHGDPFHYTLGLVGEAGEVANIIKKVNRGDLTMGEASARLGDELADVLTYLMDLAASLGIDLVTEYHKKAAFNETRFGIDRVTPAEPLVGDSYGD